MTFTCSMILMPVITSSIHTVVSHLLDGIRGVKINDKGLIADRKINSGGNKNGNAKNINNNISTNDMQVDYVDISYQFVHVSPINRYFLDYTNGFGKKKSI